MEMLETLLEGVRSAGAAFPDKRRGDVTYSMADIGLSAFSLLFMQSGSSLAHQRALEEGRQMSNCQSLFGMTAVPTDNHIRAMMFAAMNLLAFVLHTVCDSLEQLWTAAKTAKRARTRVFEYIRTVTAYLVFPDWTSRSLRCGR